MPTSTTPLFRVNKNCAVATIFSSIAFLSSSISMANLSRLVAASYSSLALFSSSVSMANLSCLLATTFSSLRFLFNSLTSPHFNILRVARRCFSCFSFFSFSRLILSLSFLCSSVSEALFVLSFSCLSEHFFFNRPHLTLSIRVFGPRNSAYTFFKYDRHTDIYISREISIEHSSVALASLTQL